MKDQYYQKKSTICDSGPHHFLDLLQSKSTHINIFQKLSNGHQVDQTIDFLSSNGLIPKMLYKEEARYTMWRIAFDNRGMINGRRTSETGVGLFGAEVEIACVMANFLNLK